MFGLTDALIGVSIHAPRAGRDIYSRETFASPRVSIHAPRAGRDPDGRIRIEIDNAFQSTRPARDATRYRWMAGLSRTSFNPRAPRGTRLGRAVIRPGRRLVSIHAPRAGRDRFDSLLDELIWVSIHAPRAGRDTTQEK